MKANRFSIRRSFRASIENFDPKWNLDPIVVKLCFWRLSQFLVPFTSSQSTLSTVRHELSSQWNFNSKDVVESQHTHLEMFQGSNVPKTQSSRRTIPLKSSEIVKILWSCWVFAFAVFGANEQTPCTHLDRLFSTPHRTVRLGRYTAEPGDHEREQLDGEAV